MRQREVLSRQRIPGSSCVRKETIDINILVKSGNGDRKITESIRILSRPPSKPRMVVLVLQWGYGKSLKSLYIVCKRVLTPLYCLSPFFQICPILAPPPHFPVTSNPHYHCPLPIVLSVVLFL